MNYVYAADSNPQIIDRHSSTSLHARVSLYYHTGGLDFNLTETSKSVLLGSGETLNINPLQVYQDGRYELDERVQLHLLPAEGETALITGEPATVTLEDSDGKSKFDICEGIGGNVLILL